MQTIKNILNFCKAAVFYNYINIGTTCGLNQVRKCIINSFYETIPDNRIRVSLSIFDVIIFKININDIENIIENIPDLRENLLYMLAFENLIRDEQQKVTEPMSVDDDE